MKFNKKTKSTAEKTEKTNFEGGTAYEPETPELALYKVVVNNLLEDKYYETDSESFQKLIRRFDAVADKDPEFVLKLAVYARHEMYLRDVPQLLLVLAANDARFKNSDPKESLIRRYTPHIIDRMDEPAKTLAIHDEFYGGTAPYPLRKGIADAVQDQADAYTLGKYKLKGKEVTTYDVFNRVHPKPSDKEQEEVFRRFMKGDLDDNDVEPLEPPETWEVTITEKGNTLEAWREVLPRMGLFAVIRNIRNMLDAGLTGEEILEHKDMEDVRQTQLYPFRFYQAYKAYLGTGHRDQYIEDWLSQAIDTSAENLPDTLLDTAVAVDLSGSMTQDLSSHSEMTYKEIGMLFAAALTKKNSRTVGFASNVKEIRTHHDTPTLAVMDAIREVDREVGNSTNAYLVLEHLHEQDYELDRVVYFTDMVLWDNRRYGSGQSFKETWDRYTERHPGTKLYMLDLSSYGDLQTPEGYEDVYNISGWNSKVLDFIRYAENPGDAIQEVRDTDLTE